MPTFQEWQETCHNGRMLQESWALESKRLDILKLIVDHLKIKGKHF